MKTMRVQAPAAIAALCLAFAQTAQGKVRHGAQAPVATASVPMEVRPREPLPVAIVSQPPIPEDERRAIESERAQKASTDRSLVLWTAILGVSTLALAGGTYALWRATGRLVAGAEKAAERQLRSYLFVAVHVENGILSTPSGNAESQIVVRITNHGSTPAQLTKVRAMAQVCEAVPIELLDGSEDEMPSGVWVFRLIVTTHFGIVTSHSGHRDRSAISAHRDRPFRHRDRPFRRS